MLSRIQDLFTPEGFISLLISIPCILISLIFHEVAHGWAAHKLGDDTALNFGRLTLNPLKHLDPIGTICMVLFRFGWAKPVPINTRKLRKPKRDIALVAAAGPLTNLILAVISTLIYAIIFVAVLSISDAPELAVKMLSMAGQLFCTLSVLNISLLIFNLIPLPPLDGSRIAYICLPSKLYFRIMRYEQYIRIAFLALLWSGFLSAPLGKAVNTIFIWLFGLMMKFVLLFV